ncbi:hypothetical protein A2U94_09775 [Bacillus sp. VT 712]|uniref:hypothetical protein n=1 Tax=Bacillaceae TaxID=186817 RepID=UPI00047411F3|nr:MULTISPECIES: hypothetical protein [Bacillaceae]KZB91761.1 hypothetical protein A2U94_09775 [Bacillus sp. VT 712]
MNIIDFNNLGFSGFEPEEDILIDTGILFAYYNEYDAYYNTVTSLFMNHILENDNNMFLYVNPTIVNEVTNLASKPLKQYLKAFPEKTQDFSEQDEQVLEKKIVSNLQTLIENEVLLVLEGDKESTLAQIQTYSILGSADSVNASIANLYGTSFLTVDARLARNLVTLEKKLPNIKNVYYTGGRHRDYHTNNKK